MQDNYFTLIAAAGSGSWRRKSSCRALVLERIGALQPVGRRQLAARLNLPEREVRTVATLLKEHGLVTSGRRRNEPDAGGQRAFSPWRGCFSRELKGLTRLETALAAQLGRSTKVCVVRRECGYRTRMCLARWAALQRHARLRRLFADAACTLAVTGGTHHSVEVAFDGASAARP